MKRKSPPTTPTPTPEEAVADLLGDIGSRLSQQRRQLLARAAAVDFDPVTSERDAAVARLLTETERALVEVAREAGLTPRAQQTDTRLREVEQALVKLADEVNTAAYLLD